MRPASRRQPGPPDTVVLAANDAHGLRRVSVRGEGEERAAHLARWQALRWRCQQPGRWLTAYLRVQGKDGSEDIDLLCRLGLQEKDKPPIATGGA